MTSKLFGSPPPPYPINEPSASNDNTNHHLLYYQPMQLPQAQPPSIERQEISPLPASISLQSSVATTTANTSEQELLVSNSSIHAMLKGYKEEKKRRKRKNKNKRQRLHYSVLLIIYGLLSAAMSFLALSLYPLVDLAMCFIGCNCLQKKKKQPKNIEEGNGEHMIERVLNTVGQRKRIKSLEMRKMFVTMFIGSLLVKIFATLLFMLDIVILERVSLFSFQTQPGVAPTLEKSRVISYSIIVTSSLIFAVQQLLVFMSYRLLKDLMRKCKVYYRQGESSQGECSTNSA